ncbi:MAG: serine hydrolase [Bacteroidota bacterium]
MKKIIFIILGILISAVFIAYLIAPRYIQKALIYQTADIDDYKIFDNDTVKAGNYQPWKISSRYNKHKFSDKAIKNFINYKSVAFVVIQHDSLLQEEYWSGYSDKSLSNSFSMAKSIVGLLIGIAIDEGKIKSVDQAVVDFLPEFHTPELKSITIKNLLTMSAGFDVNEKYSSLFNITTEAYYGENLYKLSTGLKTKDKPGTYFNYVSLESQLLSFIVEKACGKSINEYASEKLWKPIGARYDALWSLDKKGGDEKAFCCFNSNAPDFARIGQLILNRGKWNDQQVVSDTFLTQAMQADEFLKDENNEKVTYYGYQWWILNYKDTKVPYCRGLLGQYIFVIPSKDAVVVRLGEKRSDKNRQHATEDVFLWLDAAWEIIGESNPH